MSAYVNGKIYYGIKTGLNEAFVIDDETKKRLIKEDRKCADLIKPFLAGKDIQRYQLPETTSHLIFMPKGWTRSHYGKSRNAWSWLKENYPAIANHLHPFSAKAEKRSDQGDYWWELRACDYYAEFEKPKILWPGISSEVTAFAIDENGYYGNDNNQLIISSDHYLLGLLNSRLMRFILQHVCDKVQGGFYRLKIIYIEQLPIRTIDFKNPSEKAIHDKLVSLVDRMLDLHKKKATLPPSAEREKIEREVAVTDEKIDEIVCGLYGITDEEREIIKK